MIPGTSTLNVMREACRAGIADYRATFTFKTWLIGWQIRVLAQVSFFALVGERLGSERATFYLLVGNAIMIAAHHGIFALNMATGERWAGTLPLLVASPSSPLVVFSARGAYLTIDGALSALSALFVAGAIFGMELPWPAVLIVIPLTALVSVGTYCFGTFLAGVVFRFRSVNNLVVVTSQTVLMAACGINVPLSYYPEVLELLSRILPLTNGLLAVRGVFAGESGMAILGDAALEVVVAAGWMTAALLSFNRLASRGRMDGSLDYGA
jgi:ABC-2 type transport system permease protein